MSKKKKFTSAVAELQQFGIGVPEVCNHKWVYLKNSYERRCSTCGERWIPRPVNLTYSDEDDYPSVNTTVTNTFDGRVRRDLDREYELLTPLTPPPKKRKPRKRQKKVDETKRPKRKIQLDKFKNK